MPTSTAVRTAVLCLLVSAVSAGAQQPLVDYAWVKNARSHKTTNSVGLGDRLVVEVENFPKLLADAGGNCAGITLFLDSLPMNITPESCDVTDRTVRYVLTRNEKNDEAWHWLLGNPRGFTRKIRVSVGSGMMAVPSKMDNFPLRIIPPGQFYIWLALTFAGAIVFIYLCSRTELIRGARTSSLKPLQKPYSLARFQMAFWFFLVIVAYVFMWLITGELDTISASILALIGIGAGTALGSALIDANAAEGPAAPAADMPASRGFLHDVLNDGGGISFHRFQMFAWTLVLGVIFCASVYRHLAMPDFSATLLGLMGVSSGTYLGFKFPEKTNRDTVTAAGGDAANQ
jgi:hypothetical protein